MAEKLLSFLILVNNQSTNLVYVYLLKLSYANLKQIFVLLHLTLISQIFFRRKSNIFHLQTGLEEQSGALRDFSSLYGKKN